MASHGLLQYFVSLSLKYKIALCKLKFWENLLY